MTIAQSADSFVIEEATVAQMQAAMEAGRVTSRSLVETYLSRIEQYDQQGPKLKAMIAVNPQALEQAAALDAERQQEGKRSPLHGIPVVLKDNMDLAGMATTGGAEALQNSVPPNDALIVRKLQEAGAVILAKANLHELARGGTSVGSLQGQVLNPYDLSRTPGGSSGGTGAALAANLGAVGLGTDTVNSIRSPASASSLVGLRPTMGLVSRDGMIPAALSQDMAGPITRTVADAAIVLEAIAGYDPNDPITARSVGQIPESYTPFLVKDGLDGARIGILRSFFGSGPEHEEVNGVVNRAIEEMEGLGAVAVELDVPLDVDKLIATIDVQKWESKSQIDDYLASLGSDAPVKSFNEYVATGNYHPSIEEGLIEAQEIDSPMDDPEYRARIYERKEALRQTLYRVMADHQLDALVFPHQKRLVAEVGESQQERNGFLASGTGWAAITVPAGFSSGGVPIGVELFGRPFSEPTLLRLAYAYEQGTQHRQPPALTP